MAVEGRHHHESQGTNIWVWRIVGRPCRCIHRRFVPFPRHGHPSNVTQLAQSISAEVDQTHTPGRVGDLTVALFVSAEHARARSDQGATYHVRCAVGEASGVPDTLAHPADGHAGSEGKFVDVRCRNWQELSCSQANSKRELSTAGRGKLGKSERSRICPEINTIIRPNGQLLGDLGREEKTIYEQPKKVCVCVEPFCDRAKRPGTLTA
jgi:hypothetical protein